MHLRLFDCTYIFSGNLYQYPNNTHARMILSAAASTLSAGFTLAGKG